MKEGDRNVRVRERLEGIMLPALKTEEGTKAREYQQPLRMVKPRKLTLP